VHENLSRLHVLSPPAQDQSPGCVKQRAGDYNVICDLTARAGRLAHEPQEFRWELIEHFLPPIILRDDQATTGVIESHS
jgi:hypothetical protein